MEHKEQDIKTQAYRESLMKNMSEKERIGFLRHMEIADKVMEDNYEALKRLADS